MCHLLSFDSRILTFSSDAEDPRFVYEWRQEQERTLRATKGTGMTVEQVNHFVDGCMYKLLEPIEHWQVHGIILTRIDYPSYELFTETLREGAFKPASHISMSGSDWQGRQLRLVVNRNRRVQEVIKI
jgi:D-glycerate 3-kinase